ncbi:Transcriptional regulator [Microbacterium esteraromaticum]|uniref:Transcriptional regulator n=1 Tax=Microbacterium esteraromaticum TaxID=57043 RepID=A0A1R4JHK6_9MICO|nr:BTAD domain-containing putative transcriptional regulator [Microbacterium esteraromaticum]SJN31499.1 Transcriptional regulator [Microbacterium esteraromaticum]
MPSTTRFVLHYSGQDASEQVRRVPEILERVEATAHPVRTRLQTILASAHIFTDITAAERAAEHAQREAASAGDEVSRAWALIASSIVDVSPDGVQRRLVETREALRIAQVSGELEFVPTAYFLHLSALAELGRIAELDHALSTSGQLLSAFPWLEQERHVTWFRCLRATIDGQADRAEKIADQGLGLALQGGDPDAKSVWVGQLAIIRWMQGRVVELEPAFLHARQVAPHEPVWAVSLAWMWLRQGRRSAARSLVATLPPFAELPLDRNWLSTACILAVAAAELGETAIAAEVGAALQPFEDRLVTIGLGVTCWGTVSRPLALVAQATGDVDGAIGHYRRAIDVTARIGAHPWLAEAQVELAAILADRRDPAGRHEASDLAREAMATAGALGLHSIERAAAGLVDSLSSPHSAPVAADEQPTVTAAPKIEVLGTFEVTAHDGTVARWQSRKARQLLKILVARRGVAIGRDTLMHLLWPDEAPQQVANRFSVAATTVRRVLDPQRVLPSDAFVQTTGSTVRLCVERIDIDVERFLAETAVALNGAPLTATGADRLREALDLHRGDAMVDEPEESWAEQLRSEVHAAFFAAAHTLAEASQESNDELTRLECYRRILAIDGYDQRAHEGLIDALAALGAHGQAKAARSTYAKKMEELNISIDALDGERPTGRSVA